METSQTVDLTRAPEPTIFEFEITCGDDVDDSTGDETGDDTDPDDGDETDTGTDGEGGGADDTPDNGSGTDGGGDAGGNGSTGSGDGANDDAAHELSRRGRAAPLSAGIAVLTASRGTSRTSSSEWRRSLKRWSAPATVRNVPEPACGQ